MSVRAWMPLYWADYLRETNNLSAAEHGAYLLLIGSYWVSGAPLPDDDDQLRRIARMEKSEWKRARKLLAAFFEIGDGVWRHGRVEKELASWGSRKDKNEARARSAAEARWGARSDAESNAPSIPTSNASSTAKPMLEGMPQTVLEECPPHHLITTPSKITNQQQNPSSESLRHGKAAAFSEDSRQCVADFDRLREEIFRHDQTMPADGLTLLAQATRWLAAGMSVEAMRDAVFEGMTWWAKKRPGAPSDFDAFKKSLTEIAAKRKAETEVTNGFVSGHRDAASWPAWAEDYRFRDKFWNDMRGEFPASMPPEWVAYALGKTDVRPDGKTGEAA